MYSEGIDIHATTFTYGADGLRRSMKVGNNPAVHYLLNGQSVAQEGHLDGSGVFTPDVTYFSGIRGPECRYDHSSQKTIWYVYDGLGSVVGELEADGIVPSGDYAYAKVTATRKFDVYGLPRAGGTGQSSTNHGFVGSLGHTAESSTGGLIYMRARWMDPSLGRFISEDPAGDGNNWFVYCRNNPVVGVDPAGKAAIFAPMLIGAAFGAISSIGMQYLLYGDINWSLVAISAIAGAAGGGVGFTVSRGLGIQGSLLHAVLGNSPLQLGSRLIAGAAGTGTRYGVKGAGGALLGQSNRGLNGPVGKALEAHAGNMFILDILLNMVEEGATSAI